MALEDRGEMTLDTVQKSIASVCELLHKAVQYLSYLSEKGRLVLKWGRRRLRPGRCPEMLSCAQWFFVVGLLLYMYTLLCHCRAVHTGLLL